MTLTELIDSEPLNAARTDQQVLDWLKETIVIQSRVSHASLLQWAAAGRYAKLSQIKANTDLVVASMALAATALLEDGTSTFDTGDAGNVAMLDALIAGGFLDVNDKTALMDMGKITQLRSDKNMSVDYVGAARNG